MGVTESLLCKCCGATLKIDKSICECEYCGATNMICGESAKYINQLNRANKLRQECEFDRAFRVYDDILAQYIPASDILWSQTLCDYGIEYVQDPSSRKYLPTMHRIKDESILNCSSYLEALKLADEDQKNTIQNEARIISKIQNEYLNIAKNEKPYDVFICYKETDDSTGSQTEDSGLALELYERLENYGYNVFFSRVTLQNKLGVSYEPYIFAALKSAKVMVVIGTKAEYFSSIWVKNEWSRFLKLKEMDKNKQMFFACDDPEDLPRAFSQRQAQMLNSINAIQNLAFNIKAYLSQLGSSNRETSVTNNNAISSSDADIMYAIAERYYQTNKMEECKEELDKLINIYPNYAKAYWLRLFTNLNIPIDKAIDYRIDLTNESDYIQAISWASPDLKNQYSEICAICKQNLDLQRKYDSDINAFIRNYIAEAKMIENETNVIEGKMKGVSNTIQKTRSKATTILGLGLALAIIGGIEVFFSDLVTAISYKGSDAVGNIFMLYLFSFILIHAGVSLSFLHNGTANIIVNTLIVILRLFIMTIYAIVGAVGTVKSISLFVFLDYLLVIVTPSVTFIVTYYKFNKRRKQEDLYYDEYNSLYQQYKTKRNAIVTNFDNRVSHFIEDYIKQKHHKSAMFEVNNQSLIDYRSNLGANTKLAVDNLYTRCKLPAKTTFV